MQHTIINVKLEILFFFFSFKLFSGNANILFSCCGCLCFCEIYSLSNADKTQRFKAVC